MKARFNIKKVANGYLVTDQTGEQYVSLTEAYIMDCFREGITNMFKDPNAKEWVMDVDISGVATAQLPKEA